MQGKAFTIVTKMSVKNMLVVTNNGIKYESKLMFVSAGGSYSGCFHKCELKFFIIIDGSCG